MRRLVCLLLAALLAASLAGCKYGFGLVILGEDGKASDIYEDENVKIELLLEKGMVTMAATSKKSKSVILLWPEGNLVLPDGSRYTLCYISRKYFNEGVFLNNFQYNYESGRELDALVAAPMRYLSSQKMFADVSPMNLAHAGVPTISSLGLTDTPQSTKWPRLAAIKDPEDFTAPMRFPRDPGEFFFLESLPKGLKAGDKLGWTLKYKLEGTDLVFERSLTVAVATK